MAPKKRRESSAADDDVFALEEEHQPEPEKVALGDTNALKRALDDAVVQVPLRAGWSWLLWEAGQLQGERMLQFMRMCEGGLAERWEPGTGPPPGPTDA